MAGDKSHKKKKPSKKAQKKQFAKNKASSKDGDGKAEPQSQEAARKQNPKAFVFSSRGKAKIQKARTAEKEQRRMHGDTPQTLDLLKLHMRKVLLPAESSRIQRRSSCATDLKASETCCTLGRPSWQNKHACNAVGEHFLLKRRPPVLRG